MVTTVDIGTLIVRSPKIRDGRPHIAGTGITVHRIAGWYKLGYGPEEIAEQIDHLSLAQVYTALAYYHANREEIDTDLAADQAEHDRLEEEWYRSKGLEPRK
jgi:uncharacterized protein (DUF433 family)